MAAGRSWQIFTSGICIWAPDGELLTIVKDGDLFASAPFGPWRRDVPVSTRLADDAVGPFGLFIPVP
jgi:hypothetical protein